MKTKRLELKQKLFATLVVVVMIIMVFSTVQFKKINAQANVTMTQSVTAGSLSLSTVTSLAFNSTVAIGTATNSQGNLIVVNYLDYRGGTGQWTATINASDFYAHGVAAGGGYNSFASTTVFIFPGNATVTAYNSASLTGVAVGTVNGSLSAPRTLVNSSVNNGLGGYYTGNTPLNIQYNGSTAQKAGSYTATSTLTIA